MFFSIAAPLFLAFCFYFFLSISSPDSKSASVLQITNGIGWILLMSAFVFIRKSTWRLLKKQSNSEQTLLHRLIELFFTDTGGIKIVFLLTFPISGQPNLREGTWNPGLEVSGAASPEPGDGDLQQAGVHHNGVIHQGDPPMNQRPAKETIQGGRSQWSWFNAGKSIEIEMPSQ